MDTSSTKVSIITPVYCPNKYLLDLTAKLFLQSSAISAMRKNIEVIIVDDASPRKDELKAMVEKVSEAKSLNTRIVRSKVNQGFARSVNLGVKNSNSPYVLITNNDIYAPTDSIPRLLDLIKSDKKYGAVGPVLTFANGHQFREIDTGIILKDLVMNEYSKIETVARNISKTYDGKIKYADWLVGSFLLMPRSVFEDAGKMDENYHLGYHEESDLLVRVRKKGYKLVVDQSTFVFHGGIGVRKDFYGPSMSTVKAKAVYNQLRNYTYFILKNGLKEYFSLKNNYSFHK